MRKIFIGWCLGCVAVMFLGWTWMRAVAVVEDRELHVASYPFGTGKSN